ncbi:MAG: OmpH family outer membrane protein [Alphaproteobacteria bacterium]|nr:OmpH family outer membrane protein [Alphaproteobacteria bacterium]
MKNQTNEKAKINTQPNTNNIAVVDVQAVVNSSAQVKALKEAQTKKVQELNLWLQNAQNEVNAEQDKERQQALLQKYNAEFALKRRDIALQYQQELQIVSNNISQTIAEEAVKKGYSMVVAKNLVIYGGLDITEDIAKIVK